MSFHSYRVVFCAPIPTGPRTPDFGSCSLSYSFLTARGRYSGLSGPVYRPTGMRSQVSLSFLVLLDMWNMFGQKFLSFIGG